MNVDVWSETGYSEQDLLRKKALKAAFWLTCVREFGWEEEYLREIKDGIDLCEAFRKGYQFHKGKSPLDASDLPIWQAFEKAASKNLLERADIGELYEEAARIQDTLPIVLRKDEPISKDTLTSVERFFLKMAVLLE